MTRRREGPDTQRGDTHGFKVTTVLQTLGKNHANHQLQNQNTLELCKDKHISNSDQEKPTSAIQPCSNSLAEPAQNLMCFYQFKTSSCSNLHNLPVPTRLGYVTTEPHQEFVPLLHLQDLASSNSSQRRLKRHDLGHRNSQWLDLGQAIPLAPSSCFQLS